MPHPLLPPVNFPKWLESNSHLLNPTANHFCLYRGKDFMVMREVYWFYWWSTSQWLYQYKGGTLLQRSLRTLEEDIRIEVGEVFCAW
ncbi:hypothetical protein F5I97DRAFT_1799739 [Phlebopus sp. FC_14]|nr:hypothetical protein F5I97DRAFT_1799739 [Phlebopus sp. FC_14]